MRAKDDETGTHNLVSNIIYKANLSFIFTRVNWSDLTLKPVPRLQNPSQTGKKSLRLAATKELIVAFLAHVHSKTAASQLPFFVIGRTLDAVYLPAAAITAFVPWHYVSRGAVVKSFSA